MSDVLLKVFPSEIDAEMWASILEDEGIRSVIKPQGVGYGWMGPLAFVPYALYVMEEEIQKAREIIQSNDGEVL